MGVEMNTKGKVLFVLNPGHGHSTPRIRGTIYREMLVKNGWSATFVSISSNPASPELDQFYRTHKEIVSLAKDYDLIYLLKVNSFTLIKELKRSSRAKIIFDLTDALWRPSFRRAWFFLEEMLRISDAVFSENEYVCDYARKYNKQVYNLLACTQPEKFLELRRTVDQGSHRGRIRLGWIGTESTISAVVSIIGPLEKLFNKYPNLELRILGAGDRNVSKHLSRIRYSCLEYYDEKDMMREAVQMDIGLFPPPSDQADYRIRGPLKALIYMSAGIPAVCLAVGDVARIIQDGKNGMLVDSRTDWEGKIEKLILDSELRERMGAAAFETVRAGHSLESAFNSLERSFLSVMHTQRVNISEEMSIVARTVWIIRKAFLLPIFLLADVRKVARRGISKIW